MGNIIRSLEELHTQIVNISDPHEYTSIEKVAGVLMEVDMTGPGFNEFDKYFSEVINSIEIFIANEKDIELKKEVENIFQTDEDRRYRVDELLSVFTKYKMQKA